MGSYPQYGLAQEPTHPQWLNELLAAVPWIVIFLFLWFFIFCFLRRENRRREELESAKARIDILEQKLKKQSLSTPMDTRESEAPEQTADKRG